MNQKLTRLVFLSMLLVMGCNTRENTNWTHFRGSDLDAIASAGTYPVHWSDSSSLIWKAEIKGRGWSSPVIFDDQIWLSTASLDGRKMWTVCIDRDSGSEIFHIVTFEPDTVHRKHAVNSWATPTPCIEEGFVYVHFGRYGTACISTADGKIVWKRDDLQCDHVQGPGSSPIIFQDKLILHLEGIDKQSIYALDKRTGKIIWEAGRPQEYYRNIPEIGKKAYITPVVVNVDGRDLLISNGSAVCIAYDIETGEEVWRIPQGEDSTISMPVIYDGKVFFYTSFVTPETGEKYCELLAVDPRGQGNIYNTNILWRNKSPILQLLTPVIYSGMIFTVDTEGLLQCLNAETGEEIWSEKMKGKFNASPVVAGGNVYFHSTRGESYIFEAAENKKLVSENSLPGQIWATPAFVDERIYLRTSEYLYCFGNITK